MLNKCGFCGNELRPGAKFCPKCGQSQHTETSFAPPTRYPMPKSPMHPTPPPPARPPYPPYPAAPMHYSGKKSRKKTFLFLFLALVVVSALGVGIYYVYDNQSPGSFVQESPRPERTEARAVRQVPDDGYHAVYRTGVIVISNPSHYSYVIDGSIVVITVYNPTHDIEELYIGDTFVLEPTTANISGMSGHIFYITRPENLPHALEIHARVPDSFEDIFYEFHVTSTSYLLDRGAIIEVADEFADIPGLYVQRNPDTLFQVRFINFSQHGITITGDMNIYDPLINYDVRFLSAGRILDIQLLEMVAGASITIEAKYEGAFDRTLNLANIRVPIKGIFIDIPLGIRIVATGEAEARFHTAVEVRFGIRNNNPFFTRSLNYEFSFDFTARLELMADIRVKLNILKVLEVYGVYGNIGLGLETSTTILARCPEAECFVVGTNIVLRLGSIRNFGATRLITALNFGPIYFMPNRPTHFHYFYNRNWHRACHHRLAMADVYTPLLGEWEGIYTGSDGWVAGLRGIHLLIYHDGFGYRVLANVTPVEGGLAGRFSYYGNVTFVPETNTFHMQGHTVIYNPEGRTWNFIKFDGELYNDTLTGINTSPNIMMGETGPFTLYKIAGLEITEVEGRPTPGFVVEER